MPAVTTVSDSFVPNLSSQVHTDNQQAQPLSQHLSEVRNSTVAIELQCLMAQDLSQPLTKLSEKLLEARNFVSNMQDNVSPTLGKTDGMQIRHAQIDPSNRMQGQGVDESDSPGSELRKRGTLSVGDTQRVAGFVMSQLEKAYPKYPEKLETSHRLLAHINKMHTGAPYSNNDLHTIYSFFRRAEDVTSQLSVMNRLTKESVSTMDLSRVMKWHFRLGLTAQIKEALDVKLYDRLAYIEQSGSRSTDFGIKYVQSLDPAGVIGASVQITNKQSLSSAPAGEIEASAGIEVNVGFGLFSGLAELGLSLGTTETKKYTTLANYVDANSAKLGTWFSESKFTTLSNLSEIIKLANNYEKDILYVNMSRHFLVDKLSAVNMGDIEIGPVERRARPVEVHYTQQKTVTGQVSLNCFLAFAGKLNVTQETGKKNKHMDLVEVMSINGAAALAFAKNKGNVIAGDVFIQSLRDHLKLHSGAVTTAILRGGNSSDIREKLIVCKHSASQIQADYVVSKAANKIDINSERSIHEMFSEYSMLIRPDSLKVFEISTPVKRNVCSASVSMTDPLKFLDAKADARLINILQHDDPHCLGEFVELDLAGEIKTMDGLNLLVDTLLRSMGTPCPSLAALSSSLGSAALHQSHGISSKTLIKLKDGAPVVLMQQVFNNANDNTSATIPTTLGSSVKLSMDASYKKLLSETLGVQTLDFILPIARKKIKDTECSDGWDTYVAEHHDDFKELINNISNPQAFRTLSKDMDKISQANGTVRALYTTLFDSAELAKNAPTPENYEASLSHLKRFLANYICTDYSKKVQENWTVPQLVV